MNASTRIAFTSGLTVGLLLIPARGRAADPSAPVQDEHRLPPVRTPADPAPTPEKEKRRTGLGIEADVLPYILSGAHGDVWAGLDGWRVRAIAVTNTAPSFFTPSGFQNLHTTILELEVDRFFGPRAAEFRGPWVAAGGGLSRLSIDAGDRSGHGSTSALEVSGGFGWTFPLPLSLYVGPWVGFTYQFTQSSIQVGTQRWDPPKFGPVLGLKVGWNVLL